MFRDIISQGVRVQREVEGDPTIFATRGRGIVSVLFVVGSAILGVCRDNGQPRYQPERICIGDGANG